MALIQIATQSWGVVQDTHGNARSGLPVTLTTLAGGAVTVYSDPTRTGTISPVTNYYGEILGWVEEGTYLRTVAGRPERVEAISAKSQALAAAAANPDVLVTGAITRNSNGAATAASVVWPDGTTGTYTATALSTSFPGAVDAYTITYNGESGAAVKTFTQPAVTRDATTGAVTNRPAITVS